jgi:transcriptional regulator with PAS, ATPase and Fis domain
MRPELQAKLLRVIEERKIRRLGGSCEVPVDVRVLAATNRNLEKRIHEGKFREDFYYQLNVFSIVLPTLRERLEDLSSDRSFPATTFAAGRASDCRH